MLPIPPAIANTPATVPQFTELLLERSRAISAPPEAPIILKRSVDEKTITRLTLKYGVPIACRRNSGVHAHPSLAIERELALRYIRQRLASSASYGLEFPIHDVYGNERSMQNLGIAHHSTMPVENSSDWSRVANAHADFSCSCRPTECVCANFSVAVFVQSVQYLKPVEIARVLDNTKDKWGMCVVHRYHGLAGEKYPSAGNHAEMSWFRKNSRDIVASMDNGTMTWSHDACDWLDELTPVGGGVCLEASMVFHVGETFVYVLSLTRRSPPPPVLREWNAATYSAQDGAKFYALPSTFSGKLDAAFETRMYSLQEAHAWRIGGLLVLYRYTECEIVVSEAIIHTITAKSLGKALDAASFNSTIRLAHQLYSAIPNLPPAYIPKCVLATTLLALQGSMNLTVSVLLNWLSDNQKMMTVANNLNAFKQPRSINLSTVTGFAASSAIGYGVSQIAPVTVTTKAATTSMLVAHSAHVVNAVQVVALGATVTVPPIALAWFAFSTFTSCVWLWQVAGVSSHETLRSERIRDTPPESNHATVPWEAVAHDINPKFKATGRVAPVTVLREGTSVRTTVVPEPRGEARLRLDGIGFQFKPTYYESGQLELVSAVANRLAIPVPESDPDRWDVLTELWSRTRLQREYVSKRIQFTLTRQVAQAWAEKRYNVARVAELMKRYEELEAEGRFGRKDAQYHMFTKTEKQIALKVTGGTLEAEHATKAPRLILQMSDAVLITTGPLMAHVSAQRDKISRSLLVSHGAPPGIGPRHCSSEELGAWYSAVVAHVGVDDLIEGDDDGSKWDAHTLKHAIAFQNDALIRPVKVHGVHATLGKNHIINPQNIKATSQAKGVAFSGSIGRATGQSETDEGNSVINEAKCMFLTENGNARADRGALTPEPKCGTNYWIMACGDDSHMLWRKQYLYNRFGTSDHDEIKAIWNREGAKLGYTLSLNLGPVGTREFCSRWWYPLSPGEYLPGGKIGRVLARAGWFLSLPNEQTLKSAATGSLNDNYHVPFVREYMEKVLELLPRNAVMGGKAQEHQTHCKQRHEYTELTLDFVETKYGLTRQDLVDFKTLLNKATSLPITLDWPQLEHCLLVDGA